MNKSKYDYSIDEIAFMNFIDKLYNSLIDWLNNSERQKNRVTQFKVSRDKFKIRIDHLQSETFFYEIEIDFKQSVLDSKYRYVHSHFDSNPKGLFRPPIQEKPLFTFKNKGLAQRKNYEVQENEYLLRNFREWYEHIENYETVNIPVSFLSQEQKYSNEFYTDVKLSDPKADLEPFSLEKQLALDEFLETAIIIAKREQIETGKDLSEFIKIAKELRQLQSELTQNEALKWLSDLLGKARTKSIPFMRKLLETGAITFVMEAGKKLIGM